MYWHKVSIATERAIKWNS